MGATQIYLIRFNSVSASFDSDSNHDSQWLSRMDSNYLTTRNGFPEFDSNRLMTQMAFHKLNLIQPMDQKAFQNLDLNQLMTKKFFSGFWFKSTHDFKNLKY